jgi:hypothetical protein
VPKADRGGREPRAARDEETERETELHQADGMQSQRDERVNGGHQDFAHADLQLEVPTRDGGLHEALGQGHRDDAEREDRDGEGRHPPRRAQHRNRERREEQRDRGRAERDLAQRRDDARHRALAVLRDPPRERVVEAQHREAQRDPEDGVRGDEHAPTLGAVGDGDPREEHGVERARRVAHEVHERTAAEVACVRHGGGSLGRGVDDGGRLGGRFVDVHRARRVRRARG